MARFVGMTIGGRPTPKQPEEKGGVPEKVPVDETATDAAQADGTVKDDGATGAPGQPEKIEVKEPVEPAKDDTEPNIPKPPAAKAGK